MAGKSMIIQDELPPYELSPPWIPLSERRDHPDYDNDLRMFMPRVVTLYRQQITDSLGFHICGGSDAHSGMFISKVQPESQAEEVGLREADQILEVNDVNFEHISHTEGIKVLKSNMAVQLVVKYFPFGYGKIIEKDQYEQAKASSQQATNR